MVVHEEGPPSLLEPGRSALALRVHIHLSDPPAPYICIYIYTYIYILIYSLIYTMITVVRV